MSAPEFFASPLGPGIPLRLAPRLASWNAVGDPDQLRLAAALASAEEVAVPAISQLSDPLAVRLDVGLPSSVSLTTDRDLDNYLYPFVMHLTKRTGRVFRSVWGSKTHAPSSYVCVEPARQVPRPASEYSCVVQTSASASSPAYKEQISDQLVGARVLDGGPIHLELSFVVGPRRNWMNLWKPTIDSLDLVLGRTHPNRAWHPRDGRITDLGLHVTVDGQRGNEIGIGIAISSAT